jgi:hypothetical protein
MAEIQMDFIANADVLTNIKQIRSELAGMSSDHKSTTEELKKSFQQAAQGADSYDAQLAQVIKKEK